MIIANGYIEIKAKTGGGIDRLTGYPVAATAAWGDRIPCQYNVNNSNFLGRSNGESFKVASYEIFIEGTDFDCEQLRLTTNNGSILGEFSVISMSVLEAVSQTKLLV